MNQNPSRFYREKLPAHTPRRSIHPYQDGLRARCWLVELYGEFYRLALRTTQLDVFWLD